MAWDSHFLNSTYDIVENKRQSNTTLQFLKIDMRHLGPPIKGPTEQQGHGPWQGLTNRGQHGKGVCGVITCIFL